MAVGEHGGRGAARGFVRESAEVCMIGSFHEMRNKRKRVGWSCPQALRMTGETI